MTPESAGPAPSGPAFPTSAPEVSAVAEPDAIVLARVTVTRCLSGEDVVDHVSAEAGDGQDLGLAEALGMLTLATHTLVESYGKDDA